mgnify:CR=1 FL=1
MGIEYKVNQKISVEQYIELLQSTSLGERRPLEDATRVQGMLDHSNLMLTAWDGDKLVGIARSFTDFYYAAYMSDLAVRESYQQQGIGKKLISASQSELQDGCSIILLAAPAAKLYYGKLGFDYDERCWVLPRDRNLI